jgi:hypothetical protein
VIERAMDAYEREDSSPMAGLDDVRRVDGWARAYAERATAEVQSIP